MIDYATWQRIGHLHRVEKLTLKSYPDRLCIYHRDRLVARHRRSYERHPRLRASRPSPRPARITPKGSHPTRAPALRLPHRTGRRVLPGKLALRRLNPLHHVRKIVALSEIHGAEATARALDDAFELGAFSSDYIAHLLEARARILPEPSALHLTRRADLLDLELPEPDLSLYDSPEGIRDDTPKE